MTLGDLIKHYRKEHKLSMQKFADNAKVSKGYISMLENERNPISGKPIVPTIETIKNIALAMGLSSDELVSTLDKNQEISFVATQPEILTIYNKLSESRQKNSLAFVQEQLEEQKQEEKVIRLIPDPKWKAEFTEKDQKKLDETMRRIRGNQDVNTYVAHGGLSFDELDEKTREAVLKSIEEVEKEHMMIAKEKYTPHKHRTKKED